MAAGRNEPCPCGSGKKFKRCCADKAAAMPAAAPADIGCQLDAAIDLHQQGQLAAAAAAYQAVLAVQPRNADALHLLGVVSQQCGDFLGAIALIEAAIAVGGGNRDMHYNLANALRGARRDRDAIALYRQLLKDNPQDLAVINNLGLALRGAGENEAALQCFELARKLAPQDADLLANIGLLLADLNRGDEAIAVYQQALALNPQVPEVLNNLGSALQNRGDTAAAIAAYRQALQLRPDYAEAHSNLIFSLDFETEGGNVRQQAERRRWAEVQTHGIVPLPPAPPREVTRKLRIGYLSPDFRHHSAAYAFAPLILDYDRNAFEVYCYSNSPVQDDLTLRFQAAASVWRDVYSLNDRQVAEQVRADAIDILVDLAAHSRNSRLRVLAYRPAPVQCSGWGHANGTGLPAVDYLFSDPIYIPPEEAALYVEKLLYLPCVIGYLAQEAPPVTPLPARQNGYLTFGSFSRLAKIDPAVLTQWAALLRALPDSRILFKAPELASPLRCEQLLAQLAGEGIGAERITLQPGTPWQQHVASIGTVDIALDPYPHGGGISVLDCLWMGVPVLAVHCPTPPGRVAASVLAAHGLSDWVAATPEALLPLAQHKAADLAALASLRAGLRACVAASPVGNARAYAAAVETCYQAIWQGFIQGKDGR